MGLIKALTSATGSVLGDQFKEFVSCPTVDSNVLITRGVVEHGDGNKKPSDGVITNGSKITIPQGWAMMLVDNGKVVEFSSEPGEFIYDSGTEPTIFYGGLGKGIVDSIKKNISDSTRKIERAAYNYRIICFSNIESGIYSLCRFGNIITIITEFFRCYFQFIT